MNREDQPDPDALDSGASTDATENRGDEDTASGGPAEPADMTDLDEATTDETAPDETPPDETTTDPDGTPVENPSG